MSERALLDHEPGGCAAVDDQLVLLGNDIDEEENQRRREQIECRAADGLIRLQIDGGEGEQEREDRAHNGADQHGQQQQPLPLALFKQSARLHDADEQRADKRAEHHDTFQRQVDDAAALRKHACQRDDQQRNRIVYGLLNQKYHQSASFSAACSGGMPAVLSSAGTAALCAATAAFLVLPESQSLITSENELR